MQTLSSYISYAPKQDNNWHIMLHEDATLTQQYVMNVLADVFGYNYDKCEAIVQEVIEYGIAIAKTTNKQLAIHYQQQLEEQQLTVTIEEAV